MNSSEKINDLATAMCVVQQEVKDVFRRKTLEVKDRKATKYADLDEVVSAIRESAAKAGIWYSQDIVDSLDKYGAVVCDKENNQRMSLFLKIVHAPTGQWVVYGPLTIPFITDDEIKFYADGNPKPRANMTTVQNLKSATTYLRRLQLLAAFGLAEADMDGNAASNIVSGDKPGKAKPAPAMDVTPPEKKPAPAIWKQTIGKELMEVLTAYSKDKAVSKEYLGAKTTTEETATAYLGEFKAGNFADFDAWMEGKGK